MSINNLVQIQKNKRYISEWYNLKPILGHAN